MSDNPAGAANPAAVFGALTPIGKRRDPEPQPAEPEREPVDSEEEEYELEAEEVEGHDDVDDEDAEEEPDGFDNGDTYVVRVNGEEVEVTLDELLNGYSRHSDYTRKTQELSKEREKIESTRSQAVQMAEVLDQRLQEVESFLNSGGTQQEPNWQELAQKLEPKEYLQAKAVWDSQQKQRQAIQAQRQDIARLREAEWQRTVEQASQRLPEVIPEWSDESVARTEAQEITQYALSQGFAQEALDTLVDPLALATLRKAWKYDQLQSKKPKIVKKATKRSAKAGTQKGAPKTQRSKAAKKVLSGPVGMRDAAAFFTDIKPRK